MSEANLSKETLTSGDIAIVLPHPNADESLKKYQGGEVTLIRRLTLECYQDVWLVYAPDGYEFCVRERVLQKKKPPREDLQIVRWETCPWQPQEIRV